MLGLNVINSRGIFFIYYLKILYLFYMKYNAYYLAFYYAWFSLSYHIKSQFNLQKIISERFLKGDYRSYQCPPMYLSVLENIQMEICPTY